MIQGYRITVQGLFRHAAVFLMLLTGSVVSSASSARAEILKTGMNVFQTSDGRGKIIISRDEPGIFIAVGEPIDIQLFDPSNLKKGSTEHVFIKFDRALNGYGRLVFGEKRSYRVIGSLTFILNKFRIAIDNNSGYCSIAEVWGEPTQLGVLGLRGIDPIVQLKGTAAQAVLEANQLSQYREVVKNFVFLKDALTVNGQPVESNTVGLTLEPPKNSCLAAESRAFVTARDLIKVRELKDLQARTSFVDALVREQRRSRVLESLLPIKITEELVIGLDWEHGKIKTIRPALRIAGTELCLIEDLQF